MSESPVEAVCMVCHRPGIHTHWFPVWQVYEVPRPLLHEDGTPNRPRIVLTS